MHISEFETKEKSLQSILIILPMNFNDCLHFREKKICILNVILGNLNVSFGHLASCTFCTATGQLSTHESSRLTAAADTTSTTAEAVPSHCCSLPPRARSAANHAANVRPYCCQCRAGCASHKRASAAFYLWNSVLWLLPSVISVLFLSIICVLWFTTSIFVSSAAICAATPSCE